MATQPQIEATYDNLGYFHALRTNGHKDFTCAFFNGDFKKSLDDAQQAKHDWILDGVGVAPGSRVLDIGCGWGPILEAVKRKGGTAVGLTLSSDQWSFCRKRGLDARLSDYKEVQRAELGIFDAIVCVGAFEHFCSIEECLSGRQFAIYRDFFRLCATLLRDSGGLYLQTMTWGRRVPHPDSLDRFAPKDSDEAILFRLSKFYPGSWLPDSKRQILEAAAETFECVGENNGRLDYIETMNRWGELTQTLFQWPKFIQAFWKLLTLTPKYVLDADFRTQVESVIRNDQQECFIREIMSHERLFFVRRNVDTNA